MVSDTETLVLVFINAGIVVEITWAVNSGGVGVGVGTGADIEGRRI